MTRIWAAIRCSARAWFVLLPFTTAAVAAAQSPSGDRVLVVYNANGADSKSVASYYVAKRAIPATNLCKIATSTAEQIKQDEFDAAVKRPIRKCLQRADADNILYIVFSFQTPWLLEVGPETYALDQFVADIWDVYLPERPATEAEVQPYFGRAQSEGDVFEPYLPLADYRRKPDARRIYSVWRLDAPNSATAKSLVDKAMDAEAHGLSGNACFDRRTDPPTSVPDFGYGSGDWDIRRAADFAQRAGFNVIEDGHSEEFGTPPAPLRCDHAALYAGWYALDHYNDAFTWNPGAIGIHLDSASARNPRGGANWVANALARGITVTSGAITEPYLDNLPHPDQMLWYLLHGANVGDALLRSERLLKWRIINVGDPLYRPFHDPAMTERLRPRVVFALTPPATRGSSTTGVIAVSTPDPATFSIKSDHPDIVSVPAEVAVPPGANSVRFPIQISKSPATMTTVRISAASKDLQISNTLVVLPKP